MIKKYAISRVLDILINISKEFSLRDIAKKAKVGVATSKLCLDYLREKNIVKRKIIGKSHLYSLNLDNFVTRYIKIVYLLNLIKNSGLVDELVENYKTITSIILYGSSARGEYTENSDIDILIISRKPIKLKPLKAEKNINKETIFIAYTLPEW